MTPVFASKETPLRASKVPALLRCSLKLHLLETGMINDSGSSVASHTGDMLHRAVEDWHRNGFRSAQSWKSVLANRYAYRDADVERVRKMFEGYTEDPRNKVETILVEGEIAVTLPPWKTDKTRKEIVIVGHPDQVRTVDGELVVCDLKTSTKSGLDIMFEYTCQLVVYALGASKLLKKPVQPGYIIRTASYATKQNEGNRSPEDVFIKYPFNTSQTSELIDEIRREVARVRRGEVGPRPSVDCRWCPAGHPGTCSELLQLGRKERSK